MIEFKKFNAAKFRRDFKKHVESMNDEELWLMYKGITIYKNYFDKYTAHLYGACKRAEDISEINSIAADELLTRLNKKK